MNVCVCARVYVCVCVYGECVMSVCECMNVCVCMCVWDERAHTRAWVCESHNLKQNEAQRTSEESTHKGVN